MQITYVPIVAALITAGLAVIAGISGSFITGLLSESYKRHREAQATAAAIHGEMQAVQGVIREGWIRYIEDWISVLGSGADVTRQDFPKLDERVYSKFIERLGNLQPELVKDIAYFYLSLSVTQVAITGALSLPEAADNAARDKKKAILVRLKRQAELTSDLPDNMVLALSRIHSVGFRERLLRGRRLWLPALCVIGAVFVVWALIMLFVWMSVKVLNHI